MSTNYRQARKDDSSDDEGPSKRVKHNNDNDDDEGVVGVPRPQPTAASRKAASRNVWADVVQEEELAIRGNVMDMDDYRKKGSNFVKIRRGAESYVVPAAQLEENAAAFEAHKDMDELPPAAPSDDPFGDTVDLGEVEAFGVGPSSERNNRGHWQSRGARGTRGRGVRGGWMNKARGEHHNQPVRAEGEQMEMEQGEGGDVVVGEEGHGGRGGRGGWRGGSRGFIPRGRGHWRGDDRKRKWNYDHANAKEPNELMDGGYSLDALMATKFPEGLTLKELGEQIGKALGEKEPDTVLKIVDAVGEKKALEIFEETKKAEQAGGVKVADGSRRRTPGGVFILLFKTDIDVDPAVKGTIFDDNKAQFRKKAKANKRKNKAPGDRNVGEDLDELQQMLEQRKKELQAKEEREEGEATPSPENARGEELESTQDETSPESTEME